MRRSGLAGVACSSVSEDVVIRGDVIGGAAIGNELVIRDGVAADVEALAAIYDHYIATSTALFIGGTDLVGRQVITDKLANLVAPDRFLVAERDGQPIGYAASGAFRSRPLYDVRELSIYLAPSAAGSGAGRRLYAALLEALDGAGVHSTVGLVALPNPASEALHRSLGFRHVGTMDELGHKFGRRIDVSFWQRMNPLPH